MSEAHYNKWSSVTKNIVKECLQVFNKHLEAAQTEGCNCCFAIQVDAGNRLAGIMNGTALAHQGIELEAANYLLQASCEQVINAAGEAYDEVTNHATHRSA